MSCESRDYFVDLRKKKKALFLKLDHNYFSDLGENWNVSIPNITNTAVRIKLFFQHGIEYHSLSIFAIGIFYLYKQNTCFDIFCLV